MSAVSLYLDEDVRVLLAEVLRSRGYSATHALEVGRCGKSDEEQLSYAARHKMAILTHNIRDFAVLHKVNQVDKLNHFGIILSGQIPFNDLLKRVSKLLSLHSADSLRNKLIWLSDYK